MSGLLSAPTLFVSGLLLLVLFIGGLLAYRLKIPDVIIFLLLGIMIGLFMEESELMHYAAEIGIVLLFFMLGMEFPIKVLGRMARDIYIPGLIDLVLSFGVTFFIALFMGLDVTSAMLVGGVVYATSSSITAKMLQKSNRLINDESGFMLGLLIFEDVVAPILVAVIASMYLSGGISGVQLSIVFVKIAALIAVAIFLARVVFTRLRSFIGRLLDEDFFILFIIGFSLLYAGLALWLGLSEVLGAFLAGIMFAEVRQSKDLQNHTRNMRDLLIPVFFIYFGTTIDVTEGVPMIPLLSVLLVWSIVAKIAAGYFGGQIYGLDIKQSWTAGFSLTQRGEFSIIIAALAATELKTFSGMFIFFSAVAGILLFEMAPQIAARLAAMRKAGGSP
ncbi:cation:proton antiporter [Salinicoccus roseus]|uniref:Cation:proton antiporter n=1 Tax=Salinicoccus roseus TaxID=45670 RepID=A0A0C2HMP9_9STAP|nr:cation:proton antiporter [Salinicoccus roseus]KIH70806.1 sodium:proton exchanger [Salinicoccus roseus]MDB0580449.1 cation:proton antiporter [Salinicoccus roseus]